MKSTPSPAVAGAGNQSSPATENPPVIGNVVPLPDPPGFIIEPELRQRLGGICRRTCHSLRARGIIPYIKLGSRVVYDWDSVKAALLARQKGGAR